MNAVTIPIIEETLFRADVEYIEKLWHRTPVGQLDIPLIDIGEGVPLVFVPILEHLEFVYARQVREFSQSRRVILYRRWEARTRPVGLAERAEELRIRNEKHELEKAELIMKAKKLAADMGMDDKKMNMEMRKADMDFSTSIAKILADMRKSGG